MKPRSSLHALSLVWLSGAAVSTAACGGGDDPPAPADLRLYDYGIAVDVTPDGKTAAFEDISTLDARLILVDVATGEATDVTSVGDPTRDLATGIANDGSVTAMYGEPVQAAVWDGDAWTDLGSPHDAGCDQDLAGAWDVSADGAVIIGMAWNGCEPDAFRWTEAGGFDQLELLGEAFDGSMPSNRATVISDDGSVIAGFAEGMMRDRAPAMWDADGNGTLLTEDSDLPGEVLSISADGSVLAGTLAGEGAVWRDGEMEMLPRPAVSLPADQIYPNAMTGDGSAIFGAVGDAFFSVPIATVWVDGEARTLNDVAVAAGVEVPEGFAFNNVLGASADGTVLIGTATDAELASKTFVLRLPPGSY